MNATPLSLVAILAGALQLAPLVTYANNSVEVTDWQVPWEATGPRDPDIDPDGTVWFVGQAGDYLGRLDPESGEFERFDLPDGTGPHNCIVDESGVVWIAGNRDAYIGRFDPETEELKRFPMPDPAARDPHTLTFNSRGEIWFTVQHGNFIGKLSPATGDVELVRVPTPNARPYGIAVDGNDRPWVVLLGANKLATVDPETMELEEIELPRKEARPRRIAITPDGRVWYVDYNQGWIGRFDTKTEEFEEWEAPSGRRSQPYAMAADEGGRLWFVESGPQPNKLVGFDPASESFFSVTELASSAGATRHMVHHEGALWFGLDSNYISRAVLPEGGSGEG